MRRSGVRVTPPAPLNRKVYSVFVGVGFFYALEYIPFGFFGFVRLCSLFEKTKKADTDTEKETDTERGTGGNHNFSILSIEYNKTASADS